MRLINGWMMLSVNCGDQSGERGTDDHRDGQVDDVAACEKLLEALQHALESLLRFVCWLINVDVSRVEQAAGAVRC